jgi:hypothetical protein
LIDAYLSTNHAGKANEYHQRVAFRGTKKKRLHPKLNKACQKSKSVVETVVDHKGWYNASVSTQPYMINKV